MRDEVGWLSYERKRTERKQGHPLWLLASYLEVRNVDLSFRSVVCEYSRNSCNSHSAGQRCLHIPEVGCRWEFLSFLQFQGSKGLLPFTKKLRKLRWKVPSGEERVQFYIRFSLSFQNSRWQDRYCPELLRSGESFWKLESGTRISTWKVSNRRTRQRTRQRTGEQDKKPTWNWTKKIRQEIKQRIGQIIRQEIGKKLGQEIAQKSRQKYSQRRAGRKSGQKRGLSNSPYFLEHTVN